MSYCVFIPGIQGSELYQGEENRRWPVIRRRPMEQLYLHKENETMQTKKMMTFLGHDVYNKIDAFLEESFTKKNYLHYSYDWRFELDRHFKDLHFLLKDKSEIIFIAHSMGGLLTKLFIHWCSESGNNLDVSQIITLGTPWQGAPESLYWLKYGDTFPRWWIKKIPAIVGLNTADVMMNISNSFPSVYQLLPHDDYIQNIEPLIYDSNLNGVQNVYSSLLDHTQYKMYEEFSQSIQDHLKSPWPNNLAKKHHAIIGHKQSTFAGIISEQNSSGGVVSKKGIKWTSGDKTVPVNSGTPLFQSQNYYIRQGHLELAQSVEVFELITTIIKGGNTTSVANRHFEEVPSHDFSGKIYRVACPVSVSVESNQGYLTGEVDYLDDIKKADEITLDLNKMNMFRIEDSFFVFIDDEHNNSMINRKEDLNFEITAYEKGLATVEVQSYYEGDVVQSKIFEGLEITPETKALLCVPDKGAIDNITLVKKQDGKQ